MRRVRTERTKDVIDGREGFRLHAERGYVATVLGGGHICVIVKATHPGLNSLWRPPWKSIDPERYGREKREAEYNQPPDGPPMAGIAGNSITFDFLGPPSAEETAARLSTHGEMQETRVCGYLHSGLAEGVRALAGGGKRGDTGCFLEWAVLVDTRADSKFVREEIFRPVIAAIPFTDPEDLLSSANQWIYGLAAAVWTRDVSKVRKLAAQLAGTVWLNGCNAFDAALPFGGYKQSGWGSEMFNLYTETKSVCLALDRQNR
jgi:hypothetical protein